MGNNFYFPEYYLSQNKLHLLENQGQNTIELILPSNWVEHFQYCFQLMSFFQHSKIHQYWNFFIIWKASNRHKLGFSCQNRACAVHKNISFYTMSSCRPWKFIPNYFFWWSLNVVAHGLGNKSRRLLCCLKDFYTNRQF